MPIRRCRLLQVTIAATLITTFSWWGAYQAQDPSPAPGQGAEAKKALILALRTERVTSQKDIEDSFDLIQKYLAKEGRERPRWDTVKVERSNRAGYEQIDAWIRGEGSTNAVAIPAGKPGIIPGDNPNRREFRIVLAMDSDTLLSLSVNMKGVQAPKVFKPGDSGDILYHNKSKDQYYLDIDKAALKDAESFVVEVRRRGAANPVKEDPVPWPSDPYDYWTVKVIGWAGELEDLVKLFKNEEGKDGLLQTPYLLSQPRATTFASGSALLDIPPPGDERWDKNANVFRFVVPIGREQKKAHTAWMKFPMTEEAALREAKALKPNGFLGIPKVIADSSGKITKDAKMPWSPTAADKDAAVWVMMTQRTADFHIDAQVPDAQSGAWQRAFTGQPYRLVVYVGGNPEQALPFKDKKTGDVTYVKCEPVENWPFFTPVKSAPAPK